MLVVNTIISNCPLGMFELESFRKVPFGLIHTVAHFYM